MRPEKAMLNPTRHSFESLQFETGLRRRFVWQEGDVRALTDLLQVFRAGMSSVGRPVGNLLFLGPTGSGKTRIVEAAAEILFGDPRAVIKVDCAEFQHSHEIAKLIDSPPGYLGHRETHPLITQEALAQYHTEKLSFLLEDEPCLSFLREGQGVVISTPCRRTVHAPAARVAVSASGEDSEKVSVRELEPVMS